MRDIAPNGKDRPLSFHWRAPPDWLDSIYLPSSKSQCHTEARASILLEAVLAAGEGFRAVSYSRRREFYAHRRRYQGTAFTFATVVQTVDELADLGLVENQIAPGLGPCGRQSTFRATPLLLATVPIHLVADARHRIPELVILRDASKRPIPYRDTARTARMRPALVAANDAIQSCRIDFDGQELSRGGGVVAVGGGVVLYPGMRTLYRVFNEDFAHGGRMYGPFWQQAPKATRARLVLDGQRVVELDHEQLHPRLLYALAGKKLGGDAYTLDDWGRDLCKKAFNILLNAPTYRSALNALAQEIGGLDAMAQAKRLIAEIGLKHSRVAGYFHTGIGLRLQCIDADMAEAVIGRLLKQGVTALPVHDSFLVQDKHSGLLREAMIEAFASARRIA